MGYFVSLVVLDGGAINNSTAMRHFAKYNVGFCPPARVVCIMAERNDLREPVTCEVKSIYIYISFWVWNSCIASFRCNHIAIVTLVAEVGTRKPGGLLNAIM